MPAHTLICTAMAMEAAPIARRFGLQRTTPTTWQSGDASIQLRTVGISVCETSGLRAALANPPQLIVMAGLAGGLDPSLTIGDLIMDAQSTWPIPPERLARHRIRRGEIHTATDLICTTDHKAELHRSTGALVVEMENAIVRTIAAEAKIPFLGLRAVSDQADHPLDPAVLSLVDTHGRPRIAKIAATLLRRPGLIRPLRQLGKNSTAAAAVLADALHFLLAAPPVTLPAPIA
jgi:nucleoside phosphorylase